MDWWYLPGETGAGKSILVDAINQILGERSDTTIIRTGSDSCMVEALFNIKNIHGFARRLDEMGYTLDDPEELLIRREISRNGKNRCWISGQLSTLSTLQELGESLVDLHGQHEHQSLLKVACQLDLLDDFAQNDKCRSVVNQLFRKALDIKEEIAHLKEDDVMKQTRMEQFQYQIKEIESAEFKDDEETELQQQREILRHSENILRLTAIIDHELNGSDSDGDKGLSSKLAQVANALRELSKIDPKWNELLDQLKPAEIAFSQTDREIKEYQSSINMDPEVLEQLEERLDLIYRLKRKYHCESLEQILEFKTKWQTELDGLSNQEERLKQLAKELETVNRELSLNCKELSDKRTAAASKLSTKIKAELVELGIPYANFQIKVEPKLDDNGWLIYQGKKYSPHSHGWDDVSFWFTANPGEPLKPLSKIISGGELSRVMLALKTIFAKSDKVPTLVFDEIDVGIGGSIGSVIGKKLKDISSSRQVLAITHLPTIACEASIHYQVEKLQDKQKTSTTLRKLTKDERVREIARMLGGDNIASSVKYARDLLGYK